MKHSPTCLKTAIVLLVVATVAACSSKKAVVVVDETVKLAYLKEPDAQHTEAFSKNLGATLNKNRKRSDQEPGMMCDYAVTLVKQDRRAEANSWFNKEMEAFPSSRPYVLKLKSVLLPEYLNDNSIREFGNADSASAEQPKQLSPAKRKAAEQRAKNVVMDPDPQPEVEATPEERPADAAAPSDESQEAAAPAEVEAEGAAEEEVQPEAAAAEGETEPESPAEADTPQPQPQPQPNN